MVEVTRRCDLCCPLCFASSGASGVDRPFEELCEEFRFVAEKQGSGILQLSGGEPTVREDLPELIRAAGGMGFAGIQLNTNGLRLAGEAGYTRRLKESGLSWVYLQFDGVDDAPYRALRGRPLADTKRRAVERCAEAGLNVVLVATLKPGVNVDRVGEIVRHPAPGTEDARGYLSVSVSPTDCTGMKWPCRLFEVEPVEDFLVWEPTPSLPAKRASHAWRVVRELPAHEALGPNGVEVAAFLELLPTLTRTQWSAARDAAWDAAWVAACDAARVAARDAAWDAAWALVVRDLISTDHFDVLTAPMRAAGIDFDALGEAQK